LNAQKSKNKIRIEYFKLELNLLITSIREKIIHENQKEKDLLIF